VAVVLLLLLKRLSAGLELFIQAHRHSLFSQSSGGQVYRVKLNVSLPATFLTDTEGEEEV
jgi:hypothetical protein